MDLKKISALARDLSGELRSDLFHREIFASAACLYRILPRAVAFPENDRDLARLAEFSSQEKIPVTARGAGSAVAGQSVGNGIVINFTRHFNRILEINPEDKKVLVEPGVIFADLNRALAPDGLFFPPDPSSGDYCTIGGMIANNSSGAHSLFYGPTQNYVEELEVILADGSKVRLSKNTFEIIERKSDWSRKIKSEMEKLCKIHQREIAQDRPQVKNASGYLIWPALTEPDEIDFARLMAGSEGTLGLILRAGLKLEKLPKFRASGLLYFQDLNLATVATGILREFKPLAIEIMDRNFISLVRQNYPDLKNLLDESAEDLLLIEFAGDTEAEAREKVRSACETIVDKDQLGYQAIIARDETEADRLWAVRKSASPILYRLGSGLVRFIEDIVIPPDKLPEGVQKIREFFQEFKTFAPILGHAGEGNLHLNPKFNPRDKDDQRKMQILADQVYKMVISLGGSITGEHGDGILRAPYVQTQFPNVYPVFQQLKRIFDPQEILNPGKILAEPGLIPLEHIKYWMPEPEAMSGQTQVSAPYVSALSAQQSLDLIFRCHGCGLCRTYCPAYQGFETEMALPRSKVGIARALAQGLSVDEILNSPELKNLLNACYACERCLKMCPTGVSVPRILEPIRNYQRRKDFFSLRPMILERGGQLLNLARKIPEPMLSLSISSPTKFSLQLLGINPEANGLLKSGDITKIKARNAKRGTRNEKPGTRNLELGTTSLKLVYFPGCLESALEPDAVAKTLRILELLSADYLVLDEFCCGLPALSQGNLGLAKKQAEKLARKILPLTAQGYQILSNCPSCVFMFIEQYPLWLGEKGEAIAKNTIMVFDLAGKLKDKIKKTGPKQKLIYHRACHLIGLGDPDPALSLLKDLGLEPEAVIEQCCGAGGSFEMKMENAEASAKISQILKQELEKIVVQASRLQKNNDRRLEACATIREKMIVVSGCGLCRRKIESLGFEVKSPLDIVSEFGVRSSLKT